MKITLPIPSLIMLLVFPISVFAQDKPATVDFELDAGAEYDSNLTVTELDRTSENSDWAAVFNGRINGQLQPTDKLTLKGGYSYASRNYHEYNQFDQDVHTLSADASIDLNGTDLGISHHFARALLASDRFLDLSQTSLYAGKLFDSRIYLRGAVTDKQKSFANNSQRNADGTAVNLDVYYFFNSANSFWSLGIGREDEDARSPLFDNDARSLRARYSHKYQVNDLENRVQLGWRYLNRDYSNHNPLLGSSRRDRQQVVDASWALGLSRLLTLESKVEYGRYRSNLAAADYNDSKFSLLLKWDF